MRKKNLPDRERKKRKRKRGMVIDGQGIKTLLQHLARKGKPKRKKRRK